MHFLPSGLDIFSAPWPQNLIARRGVFYVKSGYTASNFERGLGLSRFELFSVDHFLREINSHTNGNFFADDARETLWAKLFRQCGMWASSASLF